MKTFIEFLKYFAILFWSFYFLLMFKLFMQVDPMQHGFGRLYVWGILSALGLTNIIATILREIHLMEKK
jgi:hypothetical protein